MKFREIEEKARRNEPLFRDCLYFEQTCFLSLRCLYNDFRHGNVDNSSAAKEKKAVRNRYEQEREFYQKRLDAYKDYQDNIKRAGELRTRIIKEPDRAQKLKLALECIGAMTGDTSFARLAGGKTL